MHIKLVAANGLGKGQSVEVRGRLFIGKDAHCHVRPPVPELHDVHAVVEVREGGLHVRDCDTRLGTKLNDKLLHSRDSAAFDGDRIELGDYAFELKVLPRNDHDPDCFELVPEGWPAVLAAREESADDIPAVLPPIAPTTMPDGALTYESPDGLVLIVTLNSVDLNDESTVAPLRADLQTLSETTLPTSVVVDMGKVAYMSSRAVGVLLAHFQRLDREGGSMRVCRVQPNVVPVLHQMRLDRLIDVYDTLSEAVDTPWE